ncbi:MAG: hypothetical protein KAJ49_11125 [Arcobacteraceae bacterium]|nr:hypothetical protein [Arcobacteraceae bacterium]
MIGTLIKLAVLAIIIFVGLNIFNPEMADNAVNKISETTGIDKNTINNNLEKATNMALDGAEKLNDAAKEKIEEAKDKMDN